MPIFSSPLRYPGGKRLLTNFFAKVIRLNDINDLTYIEPFAGGAGAALNLLFQEYAQQIIINDADYNIFCFWKAILNKNSAFKERVKNVRISLRTWKRQRNILKNNKKHTRFEVGFATFFLNRCNRSGIINARPIGGLNQRGKWKIDARFNKNNLIERIDRIALYRERIKVFNKDAIELLEYILPEYNKNKCLVYLDPPYYRKAKKLYLNYYQYDDHVFLSKYISSKLKAKWILSYDDVPEIMDLYKDKQNLTYTLTYSANLPKKAKELMFFSNGLIIPDKVRN